jgi:cyclophilin family peptidyl-prolyl cis-trans isomerase
MRFLILFLAVFVLAGCSSSEKMLGESTPKKNSFLESENAPAKESESQQQKANPQSSKTMYPNPPSLEIDKNKKYTATLTTEKGVITIELFADRTPITVNNFIFLAQQKFYDGVIFHRTIPGFMIQGGDPTGTGTGGPGYKFEDEVFTGEYTRGTVAMANAGPNTNGSQFFIMHKDASLPKNYVIFGTVTSGLEVVDAIATAPTQSGGEGSTPVTPVAMTAVTIEEK